MRSGPVELQPAREFIQRMHALEAELQQARQQQRRQRSNPDAAARWGLEGGTQPQQEEGWFLTYLDMMTLLLVAMIVMLAFSGSLSQQRDGIGHSSTATTPDQQQALVSPPPAALAPPMLSMAAPISGGLIPTPDYFSPYPAAPASDFQDAAYPATSLAALASAYPTPMDLAPPDPEPVATPLVPAPVPAPSTPTVAVGPSNDLAPAPTAPPAASQPLIAGTAPELPAATANAAEPIAVTSAAAPISTPAPAPVPAPVPASPAPPDINPQSEGESLAADLALGKLGSEVEVVVNQRSVSLRINSEILFGTGQADLSPHGQDVLKRMAALLASKGYDIVVEGHTDSIPVRSNSRYPSNWELSTDRAGSVVRFLLAGGIDKAHLRAVGFADTRPIATNQDAQGRARNRRVELVIEKGQTARPVESETVAATDKPVQAADIQEAQDSAAPSETDLILQQAHQGQPGVQDSPMNSPTE